MKIKVAVGTRRHGGGRRSQNFRISAGYTVARPLPKEIPFGPYAHFLEELTAILLGQTAVADIKTRRSATIVFAGETIARLHVQRIAEAWDDMDIDFSDTPWNERIQVLHHRYTAHLMKESLAKDALNIMLNFTFLDSERHRSGCLTVTRPVARWLGEQLIALSDPDILGAGASVEVTNDKDLAEVSKPA